MSVHSETDRQEVIIAPGVVETIIALAIMEVEGVASVGGKSQPGALGALSRKHAVHGVLVLEEDGEIKVQAHVQICYGYHLQEVADQIRAAVYDALLSQVGIEVACVDVTIDGIVFKA
ncbi:MAG: Asp23/Gls24 family envelope stress response protein [Coriobacteriales bacterium]|jgi:uncharacterized alkaline shock family protein YloU|nr:Asp23/Gls24 family envelope stress response protein [Coriobacteriales bacterium]